MGLRAQLEHQLHCVRRAGTHRRRPGPEHPSIHPGWRLSDELPALSAKPRWLVQRLRCARRDRPGCARTRRPHVLQRAADTDNAARAHRPAPDKANANANPKRDQFANRIPDPGEHQHTNPAGHRRDATANCGTATAAPPTAAPPTAAPQPPATGSGSESSAATLPIVLAALALLTTAAGAATFAKRR